MTSTLESSASSPSNEGPECIGWIMTVFGDCVDNKIKTVGFSIVVISLCLWFAPLIPQVIENCRNKRAEGISLYFLLLWLFGDCCNLVGSIISGLLPLQKIIAGYYICSDVILLSQLFYYGWFTYRRERERRPLACHLLLVGYIVYIFTRGANDAAAEGPLMMENRTSTPDENASFWAQVFPTSSDVIGFSLGSIAAVCYITSRFAQIYLNVSRQSCFGVSLTMLCILVAADFTYPLGVLLQSTGWVYVMKNVPWIVGYVVPGFLDSFLIWQYYHYGTDEPPAREPDREMTSKSESDVQCRDEMRRRMR